MFTCGDLIWTTTFGNFCYCWINAIATSDTHMQMICSYFLLHDHDVHGCCDYCYGVVGDSVTGAATRSFEDYSNFATKTFIITYQSCCCGYFIFFAALMWLPCPNQILFCYCHDLY